MRLPGSRGSLSSSLTTRWPGAARATGGALRSVPRQPCDAHTAANPRANAGTTGPRNSMWVSRQPRFNTSSPLPDPLIVELDRHARLQGKSRSSVVREAVASYLSQQAGSAWPPELESWMREAIPVEDDAPDFDAIRKVMNASMRKRGARVTRD